MNPKFLFQNNSRPSQRRQGCCQRDSGPGKSCRKGRAREARAGVKIFGCYLLCCVTLDPLSLSCFFFLFFPIWNWLISLPTNVYISLQSHSTKTYCIFYHMQGIRTREQIQLHSLEGERNPWLSEFATRQT